MTLYIVSEGSYDDYTIVAVYTDKTLAQAHIAASAELANLERFYHAPCGIEEWEISTKAPSVSEIHELTEIYSKLDSGEWALENNERRRSRVGLWVPGEVSSGVHDNYIRPDRVWFRVSSDDLDAAESKMEELIETHFNIEETNDPQRT